MTREEKNQIIDELAGTLSKYNSFYITDIAGLNSEKTSKLRRLCFKQNVTMKVAKNSLIKKALEKVGGDFEQIFPTLKGSSAILIAETPNSPAKLMKEFRKDAKDSDKPALKSACIDSAIFVGDNQLDVLAALKSKNELIGDIIGLLQSPAKNVVSALQSSGGKLAGILKTLEERAAG